MTDAPVQISDYLQSEQAVEAAESLYLGPLTVLMPDGSPVPIERLLSDAKGLFKVLPSNCNEIFIPVASQEDAYRLVDGFKEPYTERDGKLTLISRDFVPVYIKWGA